MTEQRPIHHTPFPWTVHHFVDDAMDDPTKSGLYEIEEANILINHQLQDGLIDDAECDAKGNRDLISLSQSAPHVCSDPLCPGNINRLKLAAFDEMFKALKIIALSAGNNEPPNAIVIRAKHVANFAIARAERAERGQE